MAKVLIINGPNLNRLGRRQPEVYGTTTLRDVEKLIDVRAEGLDSKAHLFSHGKNLGIYVIIQKLDLQNMPPEKTIMIKNIILQKMRRSNRHGF